jgi:predicted peptidase
LFSAAASSASGEQKGTVQNRTTLIGTESYDYQVYVPAKLKSESSLPVIVFLHGIGQRGSGGFVPTEGAFGALVRNYFAKVPAIILLPQCRPGSYWSDPAMDKMVMQELEETVLEFGAERNRLYLTGVSMGGYGVWHFAPEYPGTFAALVSICGGSSLRNGDRFSSVARKVGKTPAWLFHGAEDKVVPASESRQIVEALKANQGNVKYNEYPGVGHDVWMKVLTEKDLMPWLLAQSLEKAVR